MHHVRGAGWSTLAAVETVPIWLGPERLPTLADAITESGGRLVEAAEARAVVWWGDDPGGRPGPELLAEVLHDGVEWVQLDFAGIEDWTAAGALDDRRAWTNASAAYAVQVAEHAVALLLANVRRLADTARADRWRPELQGRELAGSTVGLLGGGAIGGGVIARLAGWDVRILALTRSGRDVPGAVRSLGPGQLDDLLRDADHVIACVPSTPETRGLLGRRELDLIGPEGTFVNVGRGALVDTDALVDALRARTLGAAAVDVTEPEPLPDGHPLLTLAHCLVTPHVANPPEALLPTYALLVRDNVARFARGEPLRSVVDARAGY
jgi:D-3-phosphoglycerate dehydrogenase